MVYHLTNILLTKYKFKTLLLSSDLRDYSDAYIVVKGRVAV